MDHIKGWKTLTDEQKNLFWRTRVQHMAAMGTEARKQYTTGKIKEVKWDPIEQTVNVYFEDGAWWHYCQDETWY